MTLFTCHSKAVMKYLLTNVVLTARAANTTNVTVGGASLSYSDVINMPNPH